MTGKNDTEPLSAIRADCHDLLLWLAGKVPDDLLAAARTLLADGDERQLAELVTYAVATLGIPLTVEGRTVLAEILAAHDADLSVLTEVPATEVDAAPHFRFTPALPVGDADAVERAAVAAAGSVPGAHGLWRTVRAPADDVPWPLPTYVYVLEVDPDADLPAVALRMQRALAEAGADDAPVEVFGVGQELPGYQRMCVAYGTLMWAATPAEPVTIAAVFDEVDAERGPRFEPDHPRLEDDEEARRVAGFLNAGTPLLLTPARMADVLDETRQEPVPMNFRTDGRWIWTDATTYYLEEYGLRPDVALLEHIRAVEYRAPELDAVAIHRALGALGQPADEEPVWTA